MKSKKCFIDVETTGTDISKHSIQQISVVILDENDVEVGAFNHKMRPFKPDYEYGALSITNLTPEELFSNERPSSLEAFDEFKTFLNQHVNRYDRKDKLLFVAYNSEFDERFVREWFNEHNDSYYNAYFWVPSLCLMKTAAWVLRDHRDRLSNFKLGTVCKMAGIEFKETDAHDSSYDIKKTIELYRELLKLEE